MGKHNSRISDNVEKDFLNGAISSCDSVESQVVSEMHKQKTVSFEDVESEVIRPQSQRDFRALAFSFMYTVDRHEYAISLEEVLSIYREAFRLEVADDSYALILARGVIDLRDELDDAIKPLLKNWKFERLGCCTRLILRLALWELLQPKATPSIVINEAIELSKAFAEKDAYMFVNGILDEYCKIKNLK